MSEWWRKSSRGFRDMPAPLKWLALLMGATALCAAQFGIHVPWEVMRLSRGVWWTSMALLSVIAVVLFLGASTLLFLARGRHARAMCVAGWGAVAVSSVLIVYAQGGKAPVVVLQGGGGLAWTIMVSLYVLRSREVAHYLRSGS